MWWVVWNEGGVHAAMVGSLHPTPLAVLPFLAPHSAAVAFCEGILQYGTAWDALMQDQARNCGMTLEQVRERMRSVLGLTDVTKFPAPKNPEAVIFVSATVSYFSIPLIFLRKHRVLRKIDMIQVVLLVDEVLLFCLFL